MIHTTTQAQSPADEARFRPIIEQGGGRYRFVSYLSKTIVHFDGSYGNTLGLYAESLTVEAVRSMISESDAAFESTGAPRRNGIS